MHRLLLILPVLFGLCHSLSAQTLLGQVTDAQKVLLPGAIVVWAGNSRLRGALMPPSPGDRRGGGSFMWAATLKWKRKMTKTERVQKYFAETLGTFALVFCGTGAIIINQESDGVVTHVGVAITFGVIVMAMIYALGEVSGAHLNPAVTLAFWAAGRFPGRGVAPFLASQIAGALAASGLLRFLFPANELLGATLPAGTAIQSFVLEIVLTFLLMLVILQVSQGSKETGWFAGLAIGGVVLLEAMFAGPICGASMNPARSLAPAVVSGHLENVWIYLIAPVLGAFLAVPCSRILQKTEYSQ